MKKLFSILTIILLAAVSAIAQSPSPGIFNYQGVARNSVGNVLINKTITLRLTIHDGAAAGPTVYQESRTTVTNPFGLFNVQVGSAGATNVTGTIAGVNWGVNTKFIQVEIDPNGGTSFINIGTAQLASVPYSLYSSLSNDLVLPFNKTQANAGTLFRVTNSGTGAGSTALEGLTNSTAGNANAIIGTVTSTTPGGFSAGVRGINNGTGGAGIGVYGSQAGSGWGVYGFTPTGLGVSGNSTSGIGVYGESATSTGGLFGTNSTAALADALVGINLGSGNAITGMRISSTGTNAGVHGESFSQDANAVAIRGLIVSQTPGGFSAAVRGTNSGTGGLGIGVIGTQAGSGWGVYGTTPSGIGVYGLSTSGFGVYGQSSSGVSVYGIQPSNGTNIAGYFQNVNAANASPALSATTNGTGNGLNSATTGTGRAGFFEITNAANTTVALEARTNGTATGSGSIYGFRGSSTLNLGITRSILGENNDGAGVAGISNTGMGTYGASLAGHGVYGVTLATAFAGVYGRNDVAGGYGVMGQSLGSASGVHGISQTGNAGLFEVANTVSTGDAVRANQSGLGRGVYGVINNSSNIVAAVRGETNGGGYGVQGLATGNGNAGFFQIANPASTSSTMNVTTNGIGSGITVQLTNAGNGARGIDVLQAGVGPGVFATSAGGTAVWGITSSISAAGVIGDNTFGEAVVGRNRGGNGVGAVVGRNDSTGYGVRGFNTKGGIGVLGQAGISGGTGQGGRFENVNAANPTDVVTVTGNGTGASLVVNNSNGGAVNLATFKKSNANVVRIADDGQIFANGGFTVGGADVAEYFEVEGNTQNYEAGDVLVISQSSDRKVEKSSIAYSTLVSGVFATKPGMTLTERNATDGNFEDMVPMGVIGVIPTKVCLEGGVIKRGDLLVTSSIAGVAMKADPDKVKVGQVLGKALQDYNGNEIGKINVLVSVK